VITGVGPLHNRIAAVALATAGRYGFALGGGCALVAHGLVNRTTEDVDLFTDEDGGVRAATSLVLAALNEAGLIAELADDASDMEELFEGMDDAFVVRDGAEVVRMSLARLGRDRTPVVMSIGPVMHLDDLVGSKVCALATRAQVRDYIDVAAALDRYDRPSLLRLARTKDPYLSDAEFAAAMERLDRLPDEPFTFYGLSTVDIGRVRAAFAGWPRT
jgi:hypothetical protein